MKLSEAFIILQRYWAQLFCDHDWKTIPQHRPHHFNPYLAQECARCGKKRETRVKVPFE
jgi:hypothetical protein